MQETKKRYRTPKEITKDHLVEDANYYIKLEKMEKKLIPYKKIGPKPQVTAKCKVKKRK